MEPMNVSEKETTSAYRTLATFTVCADRDLASIVRSTSAYLPGVEYAAELQDYITADRRPHFPPAIKRADSCVAFIDFDLHPEDAIGTVEALRNYQSLPIISVGVASKLDTDLLVRAMRAGCVEFLEKPLSATRVQETLQRIQNHQQAARTPGRCGQVITFFGVKGGVGTTALAVHVAISLASKHGKKTLLVDHHHQLGHVCLYLGIKNAQYHFDELIRNVKRLDSGLLKGFVIQHSSGLDVLASPDAWAPQYTSSREDLEQVIDFLREEYDFILIDSSIANDAITGALMALSDEIALVCTPDLTALRDTTRHIDHLGLDDAASTTRLRIILNRRSANDGFTSEQVAKAIRVPIACTIPSSPAELRHAINEGVPISEEKHSDFSTQIGEWANRLVLVAEPASIPGEGFRFRKTPGRAAEKRRHPWLPRLFT
jgi:pilus assembly protein CpaE